MEGGGTLDSLRVMTWAQRPMGSLSWSPSTGLKSGPTTAMPAVEQCVYF